MNDTLNSFPVQVLGIATLIFVFVLGVGVLVVIWLYLVDRAHPYNAVRRNYPVIGRFRFLFQHLGEFFRQYFFAMDREELPFNRAQRNWVDRAANNVDNTVAFGSTRNLNETGSVIFVNCPFPTLEQDSAEPESILYGPYVNHPYETASFFNISGMSFGAISKPAVLALSNGARQAGCWMNTGEGALSPYHLEGGADIVFQIGTAKYGVRDDAGNFNDEKLKNMAAHEQVKMFEIKLSQGAKPGKGGILPGNKVTTEIAGIRGIPQGEDSISPNRHHEVNSVDELLDFITRVRDVTGKPTGFKCVVGAFGWLEKLFEEIHRRGIESAPDFITIDSGDGGTGAAPMALMDDVGLTIRESLPLVVDLINKYRLSSRVRVIASGKLVTPSDVAWALCMGADAVVSARGFLFSLGCIQALKCNKNTCPTGITTHNKRLQRGLVPAQKAIRVAQYQQNMEHDVGVIAHSCGVKNPRELRRYHVRRVTESGYSLPLDEIYPEATPIDALNLTSV